MIGMNENSISHSSAWSLIPWMVNDTISADDRERLQSHLDACGECHAQYMLECRIRECMQAEIKIDGDEPDLALAQLLARIDAEQTVDEVTKAPRSFRATPRVNRWLAAAVVVQAIGLGTLGAVQLQSAGNETPPTSAEYRTLSSPTPIVTSGVIRFVPAPGMTVASMQALLAGADLQIVDSSPHSAIFALALVPRGSADSREERVAQAVRSLSSQPDVLFAEPILSPAPSTDD